MNCRPLPLTLCCLTMITQVTKAQASVIFGRVLSDSGIAIVGAEVLLNGPQNQQRTNEKGEFTFRRVPAGFQIIGIRMPGYAVRVDTIEFEDAGEIRRDFKLSRIATELPRVPVTTTPLDRKLVEFHERRKGGVGRFLDSTEFANTGGTRTSDRLARLPGLLMQRSGSGMFVTNTRTRKPGEPGPRSMCRAMVWLDGVNVGTEYNVNELDPSIIAAVEWYASSLSAPAKLMAQPRFAANATSPQTSEYCGILVIWLK